MAIGRFLNCKERIQEFCRTYRPSDKAKKLDKDDILKPKHWKQLEHLHDHLEAFHEATLMVEGRQTTLADHFQTLDWLLDALDTSRNKFEELSHDTNRRVDADAWQYLSDCAATAWAKANKYYTKPDTESPAYYAAILLNPQLKNLWFEDTWRAHDVKQTYIEPALDVVNKYWQDCYRGKTPQINPSSSSEPTPALAHRTPLIYTSAREHKRLKRSHPASGSASPATDFYKQYIESSTLTDADILQGKLAGSVDGVVTDDIIRWWNDRYYTQPDLARFALDIFALPPMSDDCERLFSGASILLEKRRRRLGMDIIEANECLRCSFPSAKDAYDDAEVARALGVDTSTPQASLREQAEARIRASRAAEAAAGTDEADLEELQRREADDEAEETAIEGPMIDVDEDEDDDGAEGMEI